MTDKAAAEAGKWFDYDGARFLIAAFNTPRYQKVLSRIGKKNQAAVRHEKFDTLQTITIEVQAEAILLNWEGVLNGENLFPYSRENALYLLSASMEFRAWVEATSMNLANFVEEQEAADKAALKSVAAMEPGVGASPGVPGGDSGREPEGVTAGAGNGAGVAG